MLTLPSSQHLAFLSVLKRDEVSERYATVMVPGREPAAGETWEWVEFRLLGHGRQLKSVRIWSKDIDYSTWLFEPGLWRSIGSEA